MEWHVATISIEKLEYLKLVKRKKNKNNIHF